MKLQKQQGRKYKGKVYDKWYITVPKKDIEVLRWEEGDELEGIVAQDTYLLRRKSH